MVRHAEGWTRRSESPSGETAGLLLGVVGVPMFGTGVVMAPYGVIKGDHTFENIGFPLLGVGVAMTLLATNLLSRPVYVTPGAATQWTLPSTSPPVPAPASSSAP